MPGFCVFVPPIGMPFTGNFRCKRAGPFAHVFAATMRLECKRLHHVTLLQRKIDRAVNLGVMSFSMDVLDLTQCLA